MVYQEEVAWLGAELRVCLAWELRWNCKKQNKCRNRYAELYELMKGLPSHLDPFQDKGF